MTLRVVQDGTAGFGANQLLRSHGGDRRFQVHYFGKREPPYRVTIGFNSFPPQADETRTVVKLGMVSGLLVGDLKAQCIDIEFLCFFPGLRSKARRPRILARCVS